MYDKTGLDELVRALGAAGVEIVSTGNTAAPVESLGVPVTRVEELTGFPECLDGRVKTLHPKVHAGLLADLRLAEPPRAARRAGIAPFDLLVSNLYPFTRDGGVRRRPRGVHRADRHRRPGDGAGGGEKPRQRRRGDLA